MKAYRYLFLLAVLPFLSVPANGQTGPGGVGNATGVGGQPHNVMWLDAGSVDLDDEDPVAVWPDRSGNDFDASQDIAGKRPVFLQGGSFNISLPALRFTAGGNTFLEYSGNTVVGTDYTIFLVAAKRSGGNQWVMGGTTNTGDNRNLHFGWQSNTSYRYHHWGNDLQNVSLTGGAPGTGVESYGIMALLNDKSQSDRFLFQNNLLIGQGATPADLVSWDGGGLGGTPQLNNYSNIDVAEVIFYRTALNSAQRQLVNQYLNVKYGIAISNDLYNPDPSYIYDVAGIGRAADGQHPLASSAGFYLSAEGGLAVGDYIFASHDNAWNGSGDFSDSDLPAGVERRFNRIWSVGRVNSPGATVSFSVPEAVSDGNYPVNAGNYVLLYRAGTSGDFTVVKNGDGITGGERVFFNLDSSQLPDGYYTLGTEDETASPLNGVPGRTWYTLVSGHWDDWEVWTLDPSGALPDNPQELTPSTSPTAAADRVVVLTGRTVTVGSDDLSHTSVTVDGRLDLQQTSGHSFGEIRGTGRILMAADNFPSGNASHFTGAGQGEGTVVYYGGSYSLNGEREFYDMRVELDDPANVLTLVADYTVNGQLRVARGNLRINDDVSDEILNLTVYGDVTVQSDGGIYTGEGDTREGYTIGGTLPEPFHSAFHQFTIYGNFTNRGTVRFTNQDAPVYNQFTSTGAVTVRFAGAANNEVNLYGQTDFYNLIVEKGTGRTYVLTVYSDDDAFFTLFGPNNVGRNNPAAFGFTPSNPQVRKALFIRNGTLRLTGNMHIPTLTEGGVSGSGNGDYAVGQNARLWIDGAGVTVYTTAVSNDDIPGFTSADPFPAVGVNAARSVQAMSLFGEFRISNGHFDSRNSAGFIFWTAANAQVKIEGGTVNVSQFRASADLEGVASFIQTGGSLIVRGRLEDGEVNAGSSHPIFEIATPNSVFNMSGGEIILRDVGATATNGLYIPVNPGNYNVTGGTVSVDIPGGEEFEILSTAPLYNLAITRRSGTGAAVVRLNNRLRVLNDLVINENTTLDVRDAGDVDHDLHVGRNMDLQAGGAYMAQTNTTIFDGASSGSVFARDNSVAAPLTFNNVLIIKDQRFDPSLYHAVRLGNTGRTTNPGDAANTAIEILGDLRITRGEFSTFRYKVSQRGNIEITDGRILASDTDPGRIVLNGPASQSLRGAVGSLMNFGNIELDNPLGATLLTNLSVDDVTLTNGIMYLGTYNLDVNGSVAGDFSVSRMFMTAGSSSDGGLTRTVASDGTYLFPVGTDANGDVRYTPLQATFSDVDDDEEGKVTMSVDDRVLPTLNPGSDALSYSWRVRHSGFTTLPTVTRYDFTFSPTDYPGYPGTLPWGNNWRPGKVVGVNRSNEGHGNLSGTTISFTAGFPVEEGSYTAAVVNAFTGQLRVFYSRGGQGSKDWSERATWSYDGHNGDQVPAGAVHRPGAGDIAIIGYNPDIDNGYHWVVMDNSNTEVAEVRFTGDGSTWNPRLYIQPGHTQNLTKVSGRGGLILRVQQGIIPTVNGDLGDLLANDMSDVMYHIVDDGHVNIPSNIDVYPNLRIEAVTLTIGNRSLSFESDILVRRNFTVDGNSTVVLHNGDFGNISVNGNAFIGGYRGGRIRFPDTGSNRTFTVNGNLQLRENTADNDLSVLNATQTGLVHRLRIGGDLLQDQGTVSLFTNNVDGNNVTLEFFGSANAQYLRTAGSVPSLYRIVMNKVPGNNFDFNSDFSLGGPADGDIKAIELTGGRLGLRHAGIDITLTSGGADFRIPSGTGLLTNIGATVRATGDDTGIWLDGSIIAQSGSQWLIDGGNNNYIEYSSSGNALINIMQGTLRVGSQIRRSMNTEEGILRFIQGHPASVVEVGVGSSIPVNDRGVFEILNEGSHFEQAAGATLTIANAQDNPLFPTVYLEPETFSPGEGSIIRVGGDDTRPGQSAGLYSEIELKNLAIDNSSGNDPALALWFRDITVDGNIVVDAGSAFNSGGRDITVRGDWLNQGTFFPVGNTVFFRGDSPQLVLGGTTFHRLVKDGEGSMTLDGDIVVNNLLRLDAGSFDDGGNTLSAKGNVNMDVVHTHGGSGNGIAMNGASEQVLTGNGTFGKLTVNNSAGVTVPVGNNFTITGALQLNSGVLNIGRNLLVLGVGASIIEASPFSENNMIRTNISFTDAGVRKFFPQVVPADNYSFIYPIGSQNKYTPVTLNIESMNPGGSIRVRAANERHPSIQDNDVCPEVDHTENVLDYHWTLDAGSVSGFTGTAVMRFYADDFRIDDSRYDADDYITARLLMGSTQWNKFGPEGFDLVGRRLTFDFASTDDGGISGDYTAGVEDPACEGAIPDQVPAYITVNHGSWNENSIWAVYDIETGTVGDPGVNVPAGGPRGSVVFIEHDVEVIQNYIVSYKSIIGGDGLLRMGETFGHRLGIVEGTGTLQLERGNLPAGVYDDFFGPDGGTIEFTGITSYDVLSEVTAVNNLVFSGTGARRLPNLDFRVYGNLIIDGDDSSLNVINEHDRTVRIEGDLLFNAGSFDSGIGSSMVSMEGAQPQIVAGDFTGSNGFWDFRVDNSAGVTLDGSIDIDRNLVLASGTVTTSTSNMLSVTNASETAVTGYGASAFVDGPMRKLVNSGGSFIFPVGDGSRYGRLVITNTSTASSGYWEAEYYNRSAAPEYPPSQFAPPLLMVSDNEFWRVGGPEPGGSAFVTVRWDDSSLLPAMTDDRPGNLHVAEWNSGDSRWESAGTVVTDGGVNSGTIRTGASRTLATRYYTIASTEGDPLPAAGFVSTDVTICEGGSVTLSVMVTGVPDFSVDITDGDFTYTEEDDESPITFTLFPDVGVTTYEITAVTENLPGSPRTSTTTIFGDPVVVTVLPEPQLFTVDGGGEICEGGEIDITLSGSENFYTYELYENSSPTGMALPGTGSDLVFTVGSSLPPATYNFTIWAYRTELPDCERQMTGSAQVIVNPLSTIEILGIDPGEGCEDCETVITFGIVADNSFSFTLRREWKDDPSEFVELTLTDSPFSDGFANPEAAIYTYTFNSIWENQGGATQARSEYVYSVVSFDVTGSACTLIEGDPAEIVIWKIPETGPQYHIPNTFGE